jgi:hypothetical protein
VRQNVCGFKEGWTRARAVIKSTGNIGPENSFLNFKRVNLPISLPFLVRFCLV